MAMVWSAEASSGDSRGLVGWIRPTVGAGAGPHQGHSARHGVLAAELPGRDVSASELNPIARNKLVSSIRYRWL